MNIRELSGSRSPDVKHQTIVSLFNLER